MISMMPGTGMGAAGTGMGQSPMMSGGSGSSIPPAVLAYLMQMQGGGGTGGNSFQPPAGPTTPMASMIGANQGHMQPMQAAPVQAQQQNGATGQTQNGMQQLVQILQMLKGQQTGLPATGQPTAENRQGSALTMQPDGTYALPPQTQTLNWGNMVPGQMPQA